MTKGKVKKVSGIKIAVDLFDGSTKHYNFADFDFDTMVGDTIDIFETESAPVIVKAGAALAGGQNAW